MKHCYLLWLLLGLVLPGRAQSLDPAFQPTTLFTQSTTIRVLALAAQPDGKVLAAGDFQATSGALSNNVLRLNADLTRDLSFRPALGANGLVQALAVQPDGKVLIGGLFTGYAGTATGPVARLLPTGELDPTFRPDPALLGGQVAALAVQADGGVLVGGLASASLPGGLVRLLPNGGLDPAFGVGSGAGSGKQVLALAVQPADGTILVGGSFASFNGYANQSLVRLLPSGGPDPSFMPPSYAAGSSVASLALLPTGTILAGGSPGNLRGFLPSGAPDARFNLDFNAAVHSIRVDAAGRVVLVGRFSYLSGKYAFSARGVLRLLADGTPDPTFAPAYNNAPRWPSTYLYSVLPLADGQMLLGGFLLQDSASQLSATGTATGLNLMSATGTIDPNFDLGLQLRGSVSQVVPQTDGALLLRGSYSSLNGQPVSGQLQRLGPDGRLVQDRQLPILPSTGQESLTYGTLFPQPDGQVYATVVSRICRGNCNTAAGSIQYASYLRRIRADNTLDPSFNVLLFGNSFFGLHATVVRQLTASNTGTLLAQLNVSGPPPLNLGSLRLLHIQPTGVAQAITLPGFLQPAPGPLSSGSVIPQPRQVVQQPDGKLLVSYDLVTLLTLTTTTSQRHLTRLLPDGSPDPDFAVATSPVPADVALTLGPLQADGKCFVSGAFTSFAGVPAPTGLVRLLPSGAVDVTFQPAASLAPLVPQALLPNDRLLVEANSQLSTARLRCLLPDGATDASFSPVAVTSAGYPATSWGVVLQPGDNKPVLYGDFTEVAGQPRTGLARLSAASPLAVRAGSEGASPLGFYPNPAHQRVTLVLPTALTQAGTAQLYDALGREVGHQPVPAHAKEMTLSLTGLPPGLYLLRCGAATGQLIVD